MKNESKKGFCREYNFYVKVYLQSKMKIILGRNETIKEGQIYVDPRQKRKIESVDKRM